MKRKYITKVSRKKNIIDMGSEVVDKKFKPFGKKIEIVTLHGPI